MSASEGPPAWHAALTVLPPLFDTHCHLDFETFADDFDAVIARARAAGVERICTIGAGRDTRSARAALDVARAHSDWVCATVGVHPHDAHMVTDAVVDELERLAADPLVVAVGEVGLDYHYDFSPRERQRDVFRRFIAVARRVGKPLTVHTREAPEDTLAILREEGARDVGGIIHCFSEDAAFARAALELGFVASFSGIVTFKSATPVREAARSQPPDAILIETDAPFLAPVPHRGKRNEPAWVAHTAQVLADLRGEDVAEVRRRPTANACRVLGVAPPPGI
jgi:TatD DNase family protein